MAAYAAGDSHAFDRLFDLVAPRLYGFFFRSFKEAAVSEDLMQQTFLQLHRSRHLYKRELPFRPWLFTLAARLRLDELRKRRRWPRPFSEEEWATLCDGTVGEGAAEAIERDEEGRARADLVHAALAALPESQRVIVHLNRFEGLTYEQIARALGTTEGAVKLRAFRAYAQLRKRLDVIGPRARKMDTVLPAANPETQGAS